MPIYTKERKTDGGNQRKVQRDSSSMGGELLLDTKGNDNKPFNDGTVYRPSVHWLLNYSSMYRRLFIVP